MADTPLNGIKGFFNDLSADTPPNTRPIEIEAAPSNEPESQKTDGEDESASELRPAETPAAGPRPKARRGRPLAAQNRERVLRARASFWVKADLLDYYREWSWTARTNIGELVERALADYKRRKGGPTGQ